MGIASMGDIKYTSDGRKVLVVGKLNAEQHIVQEIFICGGQEVPSGENFVVSGLHDEPVESWKEKNLRELDERYDKTKKEIEARIGKAHRRLNLAESKSKHRAGALLSFAQNSDSEQLQTLYAFMAGEITHFFVNAYSAEIITWGDNLPYDVDSWGGRLSIDGMKLVTLFGNSKGRLDYRINRYSDGGGTNTRIVPCRSYEEALAKAQSVLDVEAELYVGGERKGWSPDRWLGIDGIKVPADALEKFTAKKREAQLARIDNLKAEIADLSEKLND